MRSLFLNARILTMNPENPEAEAIAVGDGRLLAVGSKRMAESAAGSDAVTYDLGGKTVVPGLIDSHLHLVGYGHSFQSIDLREAKSIGEIKKAVGSRAKSAPPGEVISGRGWDQEKLSEGRYPNRLDLDEVAPRNPVLLSRVCGHIICVNSRALELAHIDAKTPDPPGGEIVREGESGEPNGLLKETAGEIAWSALVQRSHQQDLETAELACAELAKVGLTAVHFMSATWPDVEALASLRDEGKLQIRVRLYVAGEDLGKTRAGLREDDMLRVCGVKVLVDGSLGGRTAYLSKPYSDDPSTKGMETIDEGKAERLFESVHRVGLQLAVHSIGDEATKRALDMIERVIKRHPRSDHRHRIEHASVLTGTLIKRMGDLGLVASVQPHFIVTDFWAVKRVGVDRAKGVYAFRSLRDAGIVTAAGSDCPVEPPSPLLGMKAAVTRGEEKGIELSRVTPGEKLEPIEALEMYTKAGAYASHEESLSGSLRAGGFADFVVLSGDPTTCVPTDLDRIEVDMTVVNGKVVYSRTK